MISRAFSGAPLVRPAVKLLLFDEENRLLLPSGREAPGSETEFGGSILGATPEYCRIPRRRERGVHHVGCSATSLSVHRSARSSSLFAVDPRV